MSFDDDFYTDEPIIHGAHPGASPQPSPDGEGDAQPTGTSPGASPQPSPMGEGDAQPERRLWDYVPPSEAHSSLGGRSGIASPSPIGEGWGEVTGWGKAPGRGEVPPKDIALLMSMIRQDYWSITNNKSFYEQALFMAGYEDDFKILPFNTYFPTYRQMSYGQLRSYFTVRKLLRHGEHPDVPLSYLYVYAYETLMQIGVDNPEEGYQILCDLRDNYPVMNPDKRPYLTDWLRDYVVWYGLSEHYAECFSEEQRRDNACEILNDYKKSSDETLFKVLDDNARKVISKGVLYRKNREAAVNGVADIMRGMAPIIEDHFGSRLGTLCFGRHSTSQHIMFNTAVFYAPEPIREATVEVAPLHKYVCHKGLWRVTADSVNITLPPRYLGYILHDVDAAIRQRLGLKPAIKAKYIRPGSYLADILPKAADVWFAKWNAEAEERKENERHEALRKARESVDIDLSKLGAIREDADVVRDKLIVDEEELPTKQITSIASAPIAPAPNPSHVATTPESKFIKMILEGGDYRAYLRSIHTPAGVMVEEINNKAMEVIGDIVLEDDGENITVIDDYREDVKHLYD